jgi:geranylgeranyl diphosphate synthase type I
MATRRCPFYQALGCQSGHTWQQNALMVASHMRLSLPRPGESVINAAPRIEQRLNGLLEDELRKSIEELEGDAPLLAKMARFHLGWIDPTGEPTSDEVRQAVQGKRIRPRLALLCATAVGGDARLAAPLAAAIELLHNFTLIHDDIQDRSPNRRHRATVWRIWGDAQAINAGDALFATAQRALLRTDTSRIPPETLLRLLDEFNQVTIEIVRGQVLDLDFERQTDVTPEDYLTMIGGKTAAIVRFAAWAGAIVGGATDDTATRLGQFGEALGIGFQVRDDVLGVWGHHETTGKDEADDIRRRKKSLPILMLLECVQEEDATRLIDLYGQEEIDEDGISEVRRMLKEHGIEPRASERVAHYHTVAAASLRRALDSLPDASMVELDHLIRQLDTRNS